MEGNETFTRKLMWIKNFINKFETNLVIFTRTQFLCDNKFKNIMCQKL